MLVLTREYHQRIIINDNIIIEIADARGGKVRIGIDAPKDVKIDREEVYKMLGRHSRKEDGDVTKL